MNKPTKAGLGLIACMSLAATAVAQEQNGVLDDAEDGFQRSFSAALSGAQMVPEVQTEARGRFTIEFDEALTQAQYSLSVEGMENITEAHLHCAAPGVAGPVVVPLTAPEAPVTEEAAQDQEPVAPTPPDGNNQQQENGENGPMTEGVLTNAEVQDREADDTCPVTLNNIASLLYGIQQGVISVMVHSQMNPDGEIRGQLFLDSRQVGQDENNGGILGDIL